MKVLAVSPHLDDAVFSAGGTLARLAASGAQVTVATVFTATVPDPQGFALACQLDKGLGPEVDYMAVRREEDHAACAILGAAARHLPFAEAPHRGYGSAPELFAGVHPDDDAQARIAPALRGLLDELAPDLVLAPQAVGAHADHIVVAQALMALAPEAPVFWWRDHPYAIRRGAPAEPLADSFSGCKTQTVAFGPAARAAKTRAALAYASQLGFQFGGGDAAARLFDEAPPDETFLGASPVFEAFLSRP